MREIKAFGAVGTLRCSGCHLLFDMANPSYAGICPEILTFYVAANDLDVEVADDTAAFRHAGLGCGRSIHRDVIDIRSWSGDPRGTELAKGTAIELLDCEPWLARVKGTMDDYEIWHPGLAVRITDKDVAFKPRRKDSPGKGLWHGVIDYTFESMRPAVVIDNSRNKKKRAAAS